MNPEEKTSNASIMSVRDMIEIAFYNPEVNVVNLKLLQTILFILAHQLRILGRRVEIDIGQAMQLYDPRKSLSVSELKITTKKGALGGATTKRGKGLTDLSHPISKGGGGSVTAVAGSSTPSDILVADQSRTDRERKTTSQLLSERGRSESSQRASLLGSQNRSATRDVSIAKHSFTGEIDISTGLPVVKSSLLMDPLVKARDTVGLIETLEEQREKELRIIHQRANSKEEPDIEPRPISSMTVSAKEEEKLLIVSRAHSAKSEIGGKTSRKKQNKDRTPQLAVVTQEEFAELEAQVKTLQNLFKKVGTPILPENSKLMEQLLDGASLSDAMGALQISARIDAAEKTLQNMIEMMTDLAQRVPQLASSAPETIDYTPKSASNTDLVSQVDKEVRSKSGQKVNIRQQETPVESKKISKIDGKKNTLTDVVHEQSPSSEKVWITPIEFEKAKGDIAKAIMNDLLSTTNETTTRSGLILANIKKIETRLEDAFQVANRIKDVEAAVAYYSDQVTAMDTSLSSQMTNYQEHLTQMQHELECGLEGMAESLLNNTGDPIAVAELNSKFTNLQFDLDNTQEMQKELREYQYDFSLCLENLKQKIETIRETKSDREEVADALRDKAGLSALNGLVSRVQFSAIQGDLEKRISMAYDKFNNQEIIWQKTIDELIREINEKADWDKVVDFRDDVKRNMNILLDKIKTLFSIVGEPRAFTTTKKINKDAVCLSCSTPADLCLDKTGLPIPEEAKNEPNASGDNKHRLCYPGQPIPHARDARGHFCNRFCGGSHTLLTNASKSASPPGIIITQVKSTINTAIGSDGRSYLVDENYSKHPCGPCNVDRSSMVHATPRATLEELDDVTQESESESCPCSMKCLEDVTSAAPAFSITPPPLTDID